jgi:hypothetical protein
MRKIGGRGLFEVDEESGRMRIGGIYRKWKGEKYVKKRKMGEMGVLENEEDGGEDGYLRKRRNAGRGG